MERPNAFFALIATKRGFWVFAAISWVAVWLADSAVHAIFRTSQSFWEILLFPERGELIARLVALLPVVLFSFVLRMLLVGSQKVEGELRQTDYSLQEAQRIARVGHWDWNILDNSLFWSDEVYRIFGLEPQTFGATYPAFLEYVHPDDRHIVEEGVRRQLEENIPYSVEHRVVRPGGTIRYVQENGKLTRADDGTPMRMLGTVHDITDLTLARLEREQMVEQLQEARRMESIGIVVGGIAHDFNNVFTPILGRIALARRHLSQDSPVLSHLDSIERSSQRAAQLVQQLLAYSGRAHLQTELIELVTLVEEVVGSVRAASPARILTPREFNANEVKVEADPGQIRHLAHSLILNAFEALANREGHVRIRIESVDVTQEEMAEARGHPEARPGPYALIEIADNGPGMAPNLVKSAFEPFMTTKEEGGGLGLAAVLGIVKAHHGLIALESVPGDGTTVRVYLPLQ